MASAAEWARAHRDWLSAQLDRHGALLFRGFQVDTLSRFDAFVRAISADVPQFKEESSPRSRIEGDVFTSTDYPADYPIQFHTEYSYSAEWPMKLFFCCLEAPPQRGETPVADTRRVLAYLSPATRERFARQGVLYVRNYPRIGMGVPWQKAFGTSDKAEVERHCAEAGVRCQWGPSDSLHTEQFGEAIVRHPRTQQEVWFNHAFFFNIRAIEPLEVRRLLERQPREKLSTQTYFGDGSELGADVVEELREAYAQASSQLPWERGDVLLVDNMLAAHARAPFRGPRRIAVMMTERQRRSELPR
jgi:alpha-ketoglutarate-dependent taurine dioxygenase